MSASQLRDRFERAPDWLLGSDPGLLRLRMAAEPLTNGIAGVRGRTSARRAMRVFNRLRPLRPHPRPDEQPG